MTNQKSKEEYHKEAAALMNAAQRSASEGGEPVVSTELAFLTRGIYTSNSTALPTEPVCSLGIQQLATRNMDEAMRSFDGVLAAKPTNVVALLGKVPFEVFTTNFPANSTQGRILYLRRNYPQALQIFIQVLRYNPQCNPDPRIGIGLCLWAMNNKAKAKAAWERSLELVRLFVPCAFSPLSEFPILSQNPSEWTAQLLLGLESINASKDVHLRDGERVDLFRNGTKMIEKAFNANQKNASAANALCEIFIQKKVFKRVCLVKVSLLFSIILFSQF